MYYFSVAAFTKDFLRTIFSIGTYNVCTTFSTLPLVKFMRISMAHPIPVALVRMTSWNREMILDIKYEFLFDDFKWFFDYFTFDNTSEERIDIFLSYFVSNYFFIVLFDGKRFVKRSDIRIFIFTIVPTESSFFCFSFCER